MGKIMDNLYTVSGKQVLPIGFGPGLLSWTKKKNKASNGIGAILFKLQKKIYLDRVAEQKYVNGIKSALKIGYNLIDYSASYGDGTLLGIAVQKSGIKREDLYITSRVTNKAQRNNNVREEVLSFIQKSNLGYIDLLQIHWPLPEKYVDSWLEMEKLFEEGYVKHLGVANCHSHHIENLYKYCKIRPEVAQFEIHPLFTQKPLISYYQEQNILVEAYTPIARYDERLVRLPLLKQLERKYGKNFVQIILRWHIQNGVIPLVRSLNPSHQMSNFQVFDFEIDGDDMKSIDNLNINSRLRFDPDNCDYSIL